MARLKVALELGVPVEAATVNVWLAPHRLELAEWRDDRYAYLDETPWRAPTLPPPRTREEAIERTRGAILGPTRRTDRHVCD